MATAAQIMAKIGVDLTQFKKGMQEARDDTEKQKSFFKSAFGDLMGVAGGMLAAAGIQFGIGQIVSTFTGWIEGAVGAERAQAILNARLLSTHDAVGMTAAQINQMVDNLKHLNGVDDDTIMVATNMLLTFTHIGKDAFPLANQAALDLAYGYAKLSGEQVDLQGQAVMLGKALDDPLTGMNALSREGVKFSQQEQDQIKTLMAHNDTLGAQKIILQEVEKQFGGTAKAYSNSDPFNKFSIIMGDIGKEIGGDLLPLMDALSKNVLEPMGNWIQANLNPTLEKLGGFFHMIGEKFVEAFNDPNGEKVAKLRDLAHDLFLKVQDLGGWLKDHVVPVLGDMASAAGNAASWVADLKQHIADVTAWYKQWQPEILTVGGLITAYFLPAIIASGVQSSIAAGKIAAEFIANIVKTGVEALTASGKLWMNAGSFVASLFKAGDTAEIAAGQVDASTASIEASGGAAATTAVEQDALAVSEDGVATSAGTSATALDGLAVSEKGVGAAATGATGTMGAGGAAGFGVLGLLAAIVGVGDYISQQFFTQVGTSIGDWLKGVFTDSTNAASSLSDVAGGFINLNTVLQNFIQNAPPPAGFARDAFGFLIDLRNYADQAALALHNLDMWWARWQTDFNTPGNMPTGVAGHPHAAGGVVGPNEMLSLINDVPGGQGELMTLPGGTIVHSHGESVTMLRDMQGGGGVHYHSHIHGVVDVGMISQAVGFELKKMMLQHGF